MRGRLAWTVLVVLVVAGCVSPSVPPPTSPGPSPGPTPTPSPAPTPGPGPAPHTIAFDGERAFSLVAQQVSTPNGSARYRIPGTEGNREVAAWIADSLESLDYAVSWHHFNATFGCESTWMHNVIGERVGASGRVVVFAAHYDTRPMADKDAHRRDAPVLGANDGGSGVAVLLELARVLPPIQDTVRFVFFDGEDGGGYRGNACTDWILGSTAYAASLTAPELEAIRAFVLVDMVGDPDLLLPWEGHSRHNAPDLVDAVWGVAHGLGHMQFRNETGYSIVDDHVPFVRKGVPAIDLIHTIPGDPRVFPAWHHTLADDLSSVSAASLAAVGESLEAWAISLS